MKMTPPSLVPNALKLFTRYSVNKPTILLHANSVPQTGTLTVDPEGDLITVDQLINVIAGGGLIEATPELQEHLIDGNAQKALIRDLGKLGYEGFDQVMQVLTEQRDKVVSIRAFEIWLEGTSESTKATLLGKVEARSFYDAVVKFKAGDDESFYAWSYHQPSGGWTKGNANIHDNEIDARKRFG